MNTYRQTIIIVNFAFLTININHNEIRYYSVWVCRVSSFITIAMFLKFKHVTYATPLHRFDILTELYATFEIGLRFKI